MPIFKIKRIPIKVSIEEAIDMQTNDLLIWKELLVPKYYNILEVLVKDNNTKVKTHRGIIRGYKIYNMVQVIINTYRSGKIM